MVDRKKNKIMSHPIGKIEKVDLREIWKREDTDFTKWLADNIDYLNEVIDFDIAVESIEEKVGPYKVDVYGEDNDGNKVIIENQLEKTDHTHLGQILTYLVNLDAKTAVWITSNPVEEHLKVVEWLNETTPEDMFFYLVKVEGIKIKDQDSVAPLFTVVEGPSRERKQIGAEKKEHAQRHVVRKRFWAQFIEEMNKKSPLCNNINPTTDNWISTALGMSGVSINLVISKTYARVEVYINRGTKEKNKETFDFFLNFKNQIENVFGGELIWERMEDKVTSRIKYQMNGVNVTNEEYWPKMNEFMIDGATRLHKAFTGPVQKLRNHIN